MEPGQRVFRGKNKSADAGEKPRRKTGFPSHDLSRELLYTQPDSAFTAALHPDPHSGAITDVSRDLSTPRIPGGQIRSVR